MNSFVSYLLTLLLVVAGLCLVGGGRRLAFKLVLTCIVLAVTTPWLVSALNSSSEMSADSGQSGKIVLLVVGAVFLWGYLRYRSRRNRWLRSRPRTQGLSLKRRIERDRW